MFKPKILNESSSFSEEQIKKIEKKYNAKYLLETCVKDMRGQWCNFPAAIFYTHTPHPDGSNYFALYYHPERESYMIMDGISAVEEPISGVQVGDEVIYSRYRHDFREHKNVFVDGGRDYMRFGGDMSKAKKVSFKVVKDKLELV